MAAHIVLRRLKAFEPNERLHAIAPWQRLSLADTDVACLHMQR
jgi:hypothetical protein